MKKKPSTIDKLKAALAKVNREADLLRRKRCNLEENLFREETLPKMRKLIGKTYSYVNSFGSGESWLLYCKVVGVSEGSLDFLQIQRYCNGTIAIEQTPRSFPISDLYTPISENEYLADVEPILKEIIGQACNGELS